MALDRLRFAKDHLAQCVRKYEMAHNGEELFALPFSEYPELAQTEKDIKLFDQLFSLSVTQRDFLQFLNLNFASMAFSWSHGTSTQSS